MKKNNECNCSEEYNCGCMEGRERTCGDECDCENTCECGEACDCCSDTCQCEECDCDDDCKCSDNCDCLDFECDQETNKIKELENKIKELENKSLMDKADMINYRKRKDEEISRLLKFCNEDLVTEMLPIIDNFESAIKMDDSNLTDEVSKFLTGFKMIYGNLLTVFEKYDIKPIDGVNKPFDPTYHQAVLTEKVENVESGMVIDVLRKGYILKDKVIRPAMVKVSE